jgi:hypothetical protein
MPIAPSIPKDPRTCLEEGAIERAPMEETYKITIVQLPPICGQPKGKMRFTSMFSLSLLIHVSFNHFENGMVGRDF